MDRLRTSPLTAGIANRLAGSARVSRIWVKTASEYQGLLFVVAALMFGVMGVLVGPIYNGRGSSWRSPSPWSSTRWPSGSPPSPA
jgi:hypothetical protein